MELAFSDASGLIAPETRAGARLRRHAWYRLLRAEREVLDLASASCTERLQI